MPDQTNMSPDVVNTRKSWLFLLYGKHVFHFRIHVIVLTLDINLNLYTVLNLVLFWF